MAVAKPMTNAGTIQYNPPPTPTSSVTPATAQGTATATVNSMAVT